MSRPVLLNSCAFAATADEAAYRIDAPVTGRSVTRVLALDPVAAEVLAPLARADWWSARFYVLAAADGGAGPTFAALDPPPGAAGLDEVLQGADVVVLVAGAHRAGAAGAVGRECAHRSITVAGLVLGTPAGTGPALAELRPHARVLMSTSDEQDVAEVLRALRA